MKKIGRGWQFTVYKLDDKRVVKKLNSKLKAICIMFRECFPYIEHPPWKFLQYYRRVKKEATASLAAVGVSTLPCWMFGNPTILSDDSYEQDVVVPLRHVLTMASVEQGKVIVDKFIAFNKTLVDHSIIDRNFLITDNFGQDSSGRIVLMDLGELCTNPAAIAIYIKARPWAVWDVTHTLPVGLQKYFVEQMDKSFLIANT